MSEQMNPVEIFDRLRDFFSKYAVLPPHVAEVLALWVAHTYVSAQFYTTPRIVLSSPVPGSGKTRVLELVGLLCFKPTMTMNATTAAVYRTLSLSPLAPPTIVFDEIDTIFGSKATPQGEELRALMNSGYKVGAAVLRCDGDNNEPREFPTFAPLIMAGLAGSLPDTVATRSIIIEMKKRRRGEKVAPYRERKVKAEIEPLREAMVQWLIAQDTVFLDAEPDMPRGVEDRPAEVWEPLLAIADQVGGHWPVTAREACKSFVFAPSRKPPSLGVELLSDIRDILGDDDRIKTVELIDSLRRREESPWKEQDLTARRMAQMLAGYSVKSTDARFSDGTRKGYVTYATRDQGGLNDAFSRYLDPLPLENGQQAQQGQQASSDGVNPVALPLPVADSRDTEKATGNKKATENMPATSTVALVAPVAPSQEGVEGFDREVLEFIETFSAAGHTAARSTIAGSFDPSTFDLDAALDRLTAAKLIRPTNRGFTAAGKE